MKTKKLENFQICISVPSRRSSKLSDINGKTALSQTSLPRQEFLTYGIVYKKYRAS